MHHFAVLESASAVRFTKYKEYARSLCIDTEGDIDVNIQISSPEIFHCPMRKSAARVTRGAS